MSVTLILAATLGLLGLLALIQQYFKRRRMLHYMSLIPGPKAYPLIGNFRDIYAPNAIEQLKLSMRLFERYRSDGFHFIWLFTKPMVIVHRFDRVEPLLTSSVNLSKTFGYEFLHSWLGTGLLTSTGKKWHSRRKLLTPTFHFKILEEYIPVFNKHCDHLVTKLEQFTDGTKFDISKYFLLSTLDMICDTAMGTRINALEDENSIYVQGVKRSAELLFNRIFNPLTWSDFIFNRVSFGKAFNKAVSDMQNFTNQIILERKAEHTQSQEGVQQTSAKRHTGRHRAFLDLLLQASREGHILSDEDIREEVDTFVFEGHDTTGMGLNWATYLLGHNPDVQERLQEELDEVLGDEIRPITPDDLKQLKYLERVIKECQRIYPSVPNFSRHVEQDIQMGEYKVPAGADVEVFVYALHRDPEVFPDPETFDPDRFLPENTKDRSPFAYIPFSAGPRNCIGQKFAMTELKITLAKLFSQFNVKSLTPREDIRLVRELVLRPQDGIWVEITKRNKN